MPEVGTTTEYWDGYYSGKVGRRALDLPSQFAVFFLGEVECDIRIIDFGCGTGRDALFFASRGYQVIGVDGSVAAIELCNARARENDLGNAEFLSADLGTEGVNYVLSSDVPTALYARFFIHAITEVQEQSFLRTASDLIGDSVLAVEFRTARDEQQVKSTPSHYRRFVNPLDFVGRAAKFGLKPVYFTEGFGLAKYKQDDAHVARILLKRV